MSPSRSERRRDATKRQIMGALDDNSSHASSSNKPAEFLVKDLDGSNAAQVKLLLQDLRDKVLQQQQILASEAQTGKKEQLGAHLCGMMKLSTKIKKMTVAEFNATYKCNLLDLMTSNMGSAGTKRTRPTNNNNNSKDLETPAPTSRNVVQATPARTVRRGEAIFSKNGSPVDTHDEGTLVATVSKKRRAGKTSAVFDINVGEGRYINLTDPGTVECLDGDMKNAAISQLKILQSQMASLMAKLNN